MDADRCGPADAESVVIARARAEHWSAVRDVRLAALADAPSAFGSNLRREQGYDETRWRDWVSTPAVFLACAHGEPVGLAAGIPGDTEDARMLVAVWMHPRWRGRGVSSRLVRAVEEWAAGDGATRMQLWITQGNAPARRLYAKHGYVGTGRTKPLPRDPGVQELEMVLQLDDAQAGGRGLPPVIAPLR